MKALRACLLLFLLITPLYSASNDENYQKAVEFYDSRYYEKSIEYLMEFLEENPNDKDALIFMEQIYEKYYAFQIEYLTGKDLYNKGLYSDAIEQFNIALEVGNSEKIQYYLSEAKNRVFEIENTFIDIDVVKNDSSVTVSWDKGDLTNITLSNASVYLVKSDNLLLLNTIYYLNNNEILLPYLADYLNYSDIFNSYEVQGEQVVISDDISYDYYLIMVYPHTPDDVPTQPGVAIYAKEPEIENEYLLLEKISDVNLLNVPTNYIIIEDESLTNVLLAMNTSTNEEMLTNTIAEDLIINVLTLLDTNNTDITDDSPVTVFSQVPEVTTQSEGDGDKRHFPWWILLIIVLLLWLTKKFFDYRNEKKENTVTFTQGQRGFGREFLSFSFYVWASLKDDVKNAPYRFKALGEWIKTKVKLVYDKCRKWINKAWETIKSGYSKTIEKIRPVWLKLKDKLTKFADSIAIRLGIKPPAKKKTTKKETKSKKTSVTKKKTKDSKKKVSSKSKNGHSKKKSKKKKDGKIKSIFIILTLLPAFTVSGLLSADSVSDMLSGKLEEGALEFIMSQYELNDYETKDYGEVLDFYSFDDGIEIEEYVKALDFVVSASDHIREVAETYLDMYDYSNYALYSFMVYYLDKDYSFFSSAISELKTGTKESVAEELLAQSGEKGDEGKYLSALIRYTGYMPLAGASISPDAFIRLDELYQGHFEKYSEYESYILTLLLNDIIMDRGLSAVEKAVYCYLEIEAYAEKYDLPEKTVDFQNKIVEFMNTDYRILLYNRLIESGEELYLIGNYSTSAQCYELADEMLPYPGNSETILSNLTLIKGAETGEIIETVTNQ